MSSEKKKPAGEKERKPWVKVLEQMYEQSHPDGPYPPVEIKPSPEKKP